MLEKVKCKIFAADKSWILAPNQQFAATFSKLVDNSILDYGSGSGIFTNFLKENGFKDVVGYDPYSTPERPSRSFDIITCFEVIEHTPNPKQTLQDMLSFAKPETAIISQRCCNRIPSAWNGQPWYIAPRNGHISIFN